MRNPIFDGSFVRSQCASNSLFLSSEGFHDFTVNLCHFAGEIAVHNASDAHGHELAGLNIPVRCKINHAVDAGTFGPAAARVGHGLGVKAVAQHLQGGAQAAFVELVHHLALQLHDKLRPALGLVAIHPVEHFGCRGPLLRGIGEGAGPLDFLLLQEATQLLKGSLVLIGQSRDEAGPQHQTGNLLPQLFQQGQQVRLGVPAVHGL